MAREIQYHLPSPGDMTQTNWARAGYIVKKGREGHKCWTNAYCQWTAIYYSPDDVRKDKIWAKRFLQEQERKKLEKRRAKRSCLRRRREREKKIWSQVLFQPRKIVVFDTETTGLTPAQNVILSLSWQVLDNKLKTVSNETYFFEWPDDESRVTAEAIEVNGLTRERLKDLGTFDKGTALQKFADEIADADFLVAHNGRFDSSFILADAKEYGVCVDFSKPFYDTMANMAEFVGIPKWDAKYVRGRGWTDYKWPQLNELANKLKIRQDNIDYHQSAADVEVTSRCLRSIVRRGLDGPPRDITRLAITKNYSVNAALRIAKEHGLEVPVSQFIHHGHYSPDEALIIWGIYPECMKM